MIKKHPNMSKTCWMPKETKNFFCTFYISRSYLILSNINKSSLHCGDLLCSISVTIKYLNLGTVWIWKGERNKKHKFTQSAIFVSYITGFLGYLRLRIIVSAV